METAGVTKGTVGGCCARAQVGVKTALVVVETIPIVVQPLNGDGHFVFQNAVPGSQARGLRVPPRRRVRFDRSMPTTVLLSFVGGLGDSSHRSFGSRVGVDQPVRKSGST